MTPDQFLQQMLAAATLQGHTMQHLWRDGAVVPGRFHCAHCSCELGRYHATSDDWFVYAAIMPCGTVLEDRHGAQRQEFLRYWATQVQP